MKVNFRRFYMELKYSKTGIPYIEFDDTTRMIFVKITDSDWGYKWLSVNSARRTIPMKRNGRKFKEVTERVDFMTDVFLNGFPKGFTGDFGHTFTKKKYTFIRKVFRKYITEGTDIIPVKAIKKIAKDLLTYKEPKKRIVVPKKKKRVKRVSKLTDKTLAKQKVKIEKEKVREIKKTEKALKKREKEVKELERKFKPKGKKTKKKVDTKNRKLSKICKACEKELFTVPSCNSTMLAGHGKRWSPVVNKKVPCKSCGVFPGGRHHLYCPHEECPRCNDKFVTCGCF